uniref:THIF-type NAD/FAD binding fold domain-containing protein n=2 Tax=Odontella aurita TaxID=265563 RepID=A0A7S4MC74_9STRA|mmetsp:Transcript_17857/g.51812  ORF Transcript_17857/g.51812 Transcript_17857/m.51812 type:complete len:285 (+) Transcript_17857:470-1324(+)
MPSSFFSPSERVSPETGGNEPISQAVDNREEGSESLRKKAKVVTVARAMQEHVHELNPLLDECEVNETLVEDVPDEYFAKFDLVIASCLGISQATRIASATTSAGGKFYLVDTFGLNGCAMVDLGKDHEFRREQGKKLLSVEKLPNYVSLKEMMSMKLSEATGRWDKVPPKIWAIYRAFLAYEGETGHFPASKRSDDFVEKTKKWLESSGSDKVGSDYLGADDDLKLLSTLASAEVSPVCAVLGGVLGNEAIKILSGKGEPANNLLMFDGSDGSYRSFLLKPPQ